MTQCFARSPQRDAAPLSPALRDKLDALMKYIGAAHGEVEAPFIRLLEEHDYDLNASALAYFVPSANAARPKHRARRGSGRGGAAVRAVPPYPPPRQPPHRVARHQQLPRQPPQPAQQPAREGQVRFDANAAIASVRAELRACVGADTTPSAAQKLRVQALVRRFAAARQLSFVVLLLRTVRLIYLPH